MRAILTLYSTLLLAQDLGEMSQRAKQAMSEGRFEDAAAIYERMTAEVPGDPGLRLNLGLALFSLGNYPRAETELKKAAQGRPDLESAWLLLGLTYQKQHRPALAVAPLLKALELKPDGDTARLELADAYLTTGKARLAAQEFRHLSERQPRNPKAWQGLGLSYVELAKSAAQRLEQAAPESAYRSVVLADAALGQQRWNNAFALYRKALESGPPITGVHASLARIYRETGHPDWADIEAAREPAGRVFDAEDLLGRFEGRTSAEALFWTARAYADLCERALTRLRDLPESAALHELIAQSYELRGRRSEAVAEWREAWRLAPDETRLEGSLARALWRNREYDEAQPLLERLVNQQPSVAEWSYLLGDLFFRLEQSEKALPYLENALKREPDQIAAHAVLGRVYMQMGQVEKAIPHLRTAMKTDGDGSLHYQLGLAYRRTGHPDQANAMFRVQREMQARAPVEHSADIQPPGLH